MKNDIYPCPREKPTKEGKNSGKTKGKYPV
jgi:hypothetical protein